MEHLVWGIVDDAAFVYCDAMVGRCASFNVGTARRYTKSKVVGQVMSSNEPSPARNMDVEID